MAADRDWLIEVFAAYGPVRLRRMFGGHGIYDGDLIIGLEAFGHIWLKTDDDSVDAFKAAGSRQFTYPGKTMPVTLPYWLLPEEALDDPEQMLIWARRAAEASRRSVAKKLSAVKKTSAVKKPRAAKQPVTKKPAGKLAKKALKPVQPALKSGTAVSRSKR